MVYFEISDTRRERLKKNKLPLIAVIIPTLFEGKDLALSIKSVLKSDFPKNKIRIYVALNKATDGITRDFAYSFKDRGVRVVETHLNGKAAVMNYVLKHVIKKERFFLTLDADSVADKNLIKRLLSGFKDEKTGVVTPSVAVYKPKKAVELIQKYDYLFSIVLRKAFSHVGNLLVAPGPGSMFRTSAVREVGYFDENNVTEDMEIAIRLLLHGYNVENRIDAFSYTIVPTSVSSLLKQRVRWYSGFFFNMFKYRKRITNDKRNGLIDKNIMLLIFASVFLSMLALPLVAYYIYIGITYAYTLIANVGIVFLSSQIYSEMLSIMFSVDTLSFLSIMLLIFGAYSMFYAIKLVNKRLNAVKDTLGVAIYVALFSYFLGLTWMYGFINATVFRRSMMWKIKNRN
jgi:cellulose synthase/poly-beta-1,6-N-acetylglucosamine synthase-like glycosyltransferase